MVEFKVCQSLTTGLFYFARFSEGVILPGDDPRWQAPHHDYVSAYRAAMVEAKKENTTPVPGRVTFKVWGDIYMPAPPVKPPKKPRGRK